MNTIAFILISTLEYIAIFIFLLTVFRMPIKGSIHIVIAIGLLESVLSFIVRYVGHVAFMSIILQIGLMIFLFMISWKIQFFYSFVSVVISYTSYLAVQTTIFMVMNMAGLFYVEELQKEIVEGASILGYLLQITTVLGMMFMSLMIKIRNYGFTFIPDAFRKVDLKKPLNIALLSASVFSVIVSSAMVYIGASSNELYILLFLLSILLVQFSLIYILYKKDVSDD